MNLVVRRVGLIGYGEVGRILAEELRAQGIEVVAHDRKTGGDAEPLRRHAEDHGVRLVATAADAVADAELVFSAVTARQAVPAAAAVADALAPGALLVDLNSASPQAKQQAAALVDAGAGRYVEAAVMTSVPPHRLRVPMLLGGPHADQGAEILQSLGFTQVAAHDERLGIASATKLCRSVVIKGLEAIMVESLTTARAWGVEDAVLDSLAETFPGIDWEQQGDYFLHRVAQHGRRRSEEVAEAGAMVADTGLPGGTPAGAAEVQAWVADRADDGSVTREPGHGWRELADQLLAAARTRAAGQG
ncbi:dehydrogenase [Enemella evansiae]|uniref:NAD(P)-dependent oxidoreductase n=1 Tax=Enemella evansiae TaxID=2016499 RepID=UPI000B968879|nr:DUF1932 domain-containing protein [Enemella evansiae]OYN95366.1 dehydrogenase [Enemella evansiae]